MKTAALPALRVTPQLRRELEQVLEPDETLSRFMEDALRARVEWRRAQLEFVAQGLAEADRARAQGDYVDADEVLRRIDGVLSRASRRTRQTKSRP